MPKFTAEQLKQIELEDNADPATLTPEQLRRRRSRERKRASRETAKSEKEAAKQAASEINLPINEWRALNLSRLTAYQRDVLTSYSEEIEDTLYWLDQNVRGKYRPEPKNFVSLWEGLADIERQVQTFGLTYQTKTFDKSSEKYRASAEFRKEVHGYDEAIFDGKNATEWYLLTGLVVALPSEVGEYFTVPFLDRTQGAMKYERAECSCGKSISFPAFLCEALRSLKLPFRCNPCQDRIGGVTK